MKLRHALLAFAAGLALTAGAASAQDFKFPIGEDQKFNWKSLEDFKAAHGDLAGQTLTIFGPWRGEDDTLVRSVLAYFTDATGIEVEYSSSENYEQQVVIDTQAGSPADITVLPQPGLIADLASKGFLVPLGDDTQKWLLDNYAAGQSWVDLGTYKGKDGTPAPLRLPLQDRREVPRLVLARELRGRRLRGADDHGGAEGADRADRRRRRHAVVHRPRFGRRHRLAGDRLDRRPHAPHPAAGSLRRVGHERDPVQRRAHRRGDR